MGPGGSRFPAILNEEEKKNLLQEENNSGRKWICSELRTL